jgi:hypothetical protein
VLIVCEYLVSKNIVCKIVLSRLIVGHTHEDIDSKFGVVWKYIRNKMVASPQQYKTALEKCLKKKDSNNFIEVIDLFAIPDYVDYFKDCLDPKFGRYCKEEQTQHQFIFEKVDKDVNFPCGVKTTYRAYSADKVIEIVDDENEELKVKVRNVQVKTFPTAEANQCDVDGMYIMQNLPDFKLLKLVPFPKGYMSNNKLVTTVDQFSKLMKDITKYFSKTQPNIVKEWEEFGKRVPDTNSVEEFVEK